MNHLTCSRIVLLCVASYATISGTWGLGSVSVVFGQQIHPIEAFVLAEDRAQALEQFVPGTEDYFYYHCLHYQQLEKFEEVERLLREWRVRTGRTEKVIEIEHRRALLSYQSNPEESLRYLIVALDLKFDHQRIVPDAERQLSSKFDNELISVNRLLEITLQKDAYATNGIHVNALPLLANAEMTLQRRSHLLGRLVTPDYPGLVDLIVKDMRARESWNFGELPIHNALTVSQLQTLVKQEPRLLNNTNYVTLYLRKLAPNQDNDWLVDDQQLRAYLDRMWQFAEALAPVHNSLRANIVYRKLLLDKQAGVFDRNLFETYLKLPRNLGYVEAKYRQLYSNRQNEFVSLSASYPETCLAPIGDDEPLVRFYLAHYLKDADDEKAFSTWVADGYLRQLMAEVKLVNGLGDSQRWARVLSPEQMQTLTGRVDLEFAPTTLKEWDVAAPVQLKVTTKNIKQLIVKVFQLNAENYYRQFGKEIATDVNLDGLVPSFQETYEYDDAPLLRKERTFGLEQMQGAGVYVVDFIGNGISSRALVRKGRLDFYVENTLFGQRFVVFDQAGNPVANAKILVGGKEYLPNAEGDLMVPYSTQPGPETVVVSQQLNAVETDAGNVLATLGQFQHLSEDYQMSAGIHVDRESLIRGNLAKIVVRPSLQLLGNVVPIGLLENAKLTVTSLDLDGIANSQTLPVRVQDNQDIVSQFTVPKRTVSLAITFNADVKSVSKAESQKLSANRNYQINGIDRTHQIDQALLVPTASGYFLEVRGKSGELKPGRGVSVLAKHHWFDEVVTNLLVTDAAGRIELGVLAGVQWIKATPSEGQEMVWNLVDPTQTLDSVYHALEGSPVVVPLAALTLTGEAAAGGADPKANEPKKADGESIEGEMSGNFVEINRNEFALFEVRSGLPVRDCFEEVRGLPGRLVISGLLPGDYQLHLKDQDQVVQIKVTRGQAKAGVLVGRNRMLEQRRPIRLSIGQVRRQDNEVWVQVDGSLATTRVHVFASRFDQPFDAFASLAVNSPRGPFSLKPGRSLSSYVEGRDIGEEMRYILDRKSISKYPGNMLPRPSLLLNPWKLQDTINSNQIAAAGGEFEKRSNANLGLQSESATAASVRLPGTGLTDFSQMDFMVQPSVLLLNLVPDKEGWVKVAVEDLVGKQVIQVVAQDHQAQVSAKLLLGAENVRSRDLRLLNGLEASQHFAQTKVAMIVKKDQEFSVDLDTDPTVNVYDDLGDVYRFLKAKHNNSDFSEFAFVTQWSSKSQDEKLRLYSEFACHELHFFLFCKDKTFFDEIVRPYLGSKFGKTYLDQWLLGQAIDSYDEALHFDNLNLLERLLMASRLPQRRSDIAKNVIEQVALVPLDRSLLDLNFDAAIQNFEFQGVDAKSRGVFLGQKDNATAMMDDEVALSFMDKSSPEQDFNVDGLAAGGGVGGGLGGFGGRAGIPLAPNSMDKAKKAQPMTRSLGRSGESRPSESAKADLELSDPTAGLEMQRNLAELEDSDGAGMQDLMEGGDAADKLKELRKQVANRLYRRLKPTSEWVENNYYHFAPDQSPASLIAANRFWQDYAQYVEQGGDGSFLSTNFMDVGNSFTEMMMVLSLLDLPQDGPGHQPIEGEEKWTLTAAGDSIVLSQQLAPAVIKGGNTTILVSENFFQQNDRYYTEEGNRYDKFVTEEFVTHAVYGGQVVVTNPTSAPQKIEVLLQIPRGAMSVAGTRMTKMIPMTLAPYNTQTFEYFFYFPKLGQFEHYPAHASREQQVLASATGLAFNVVDQPTKQDTTSWRFVSQNGSEDEVYEFLKAANLHDLDLSMIAFRMQDKLFFERVIRLLENRKVFQPVLWSYALKHDDQRRIATGLLKNSTFVSQIGNYFDGDWIQLTPADVYQYEHREYWPLVNSRTHQLGRDRQILNPSFYQQYSRLLDILARKRSLSAQDHLSLAYYLFLQDRIDEAFIQFDVVKPEDVGNSIQWDYFAAYAAIYRQQPEVAGRIAQDYQRYPVERWQERFRSVAAQVAQITGQPINGDGLGKQNADPLAKDNVPVADDATDSFDNEKLFGEHTDQSQIAETTPSFDFAIQGELAKIRYRNLKQVTVNYYSIDLELLFSRNPFAEGQQQGYSWVKPNLVDSKPLDSAVSEVAITIPDQLANQNVLIEVRGGNQVQTETYYSRSMDVQFAEAFGQLLVTSQAEKKPMSKVYVKVYAKLGSGQVMFFKDGYTDMRGRFDYVSQSNLSLDNVTQLAVLVSSEKNGAIVKTVAPPQE